MEAKLCSSENGNYYLIHKDKSAYEPGFIIGSSFERLYENDGIYKLSINNCQAIEYDYDLNHLAKEFCENLDEEEGEAWSNDYEELPKRMAEFARKAFEMLSSKKFSKEVLEKLWDKSPIFTHNPTRENSFEESVKSILQKEWIVEIVSEMTLVGQCSCPCHRKNSGIMHIMACCDPKMIETPKLDEDGCLILKIKN